MKPGRAKTPWMRLERAGSHGERQVASGPREDRAVDWTMRKGGGGLCGGGPPPSSNQRPAQVGHGAAGAKPADTGAGGGGTAGTATAPTGAPQHGGALLTTRRLQQLHPADRTTVATRAAIDKCFTYMI